MTSPAKKDVDKSIKKCWDLKAGTEFRFEVSVSQSITLKLCSGTAEIYGSELALGKEYVFSGIKYAVFSFDGASIEVSGVCAVEYVSSECVVPYFLNLHLCLESIRTAAQNRTCKSPRVLIVGNGRNSCARTLINYSVRHERTPLVADMDVMNGSLLFPGVIVSSSINRMIEPEESFQLSSPLAFYYGSPDWTANHRYFYQLIGSLGQQVKDRLAAIESPLTKNEKNKYSGLLAIFPTWIDGKAEQLLKRTIAALQINLVVVVGNERLYNFIQKEHESKEVKILSITKSLGLVTKDSSFRRYQTARQIKEYFYGFADEFYPYSQTLGFKEVEIWKIEDGIAPPVSALPIGAERKLEELSISRIDPTPALTYSILGISQAKMASDAENSEELSLHSVFGFIYVTEVDMQKEKITFLCTCPGKLPSNILLYGSIKWIEQHRS